MQFLHQILHRRPFLQVNAVHRLVLGLHGRLLNHLRRSRRSRIGLRDLVHGDHIDAQSSMQNRNRLQAHRAPDHYRSRAFVHHHTRPRINLNLDALHLVQQLRNLFARRGGNLHPAAVDCVCPWRAQRLVDPRGHLFGGMKVRIVQHHVDHPHLLQVKGHRPLHQRPAGNPSRGRMVRQLCIAAARSHVAAQHQRPLSLRVDLSVRSVERGHQQNAPLERARIAGRGDSDIHLVARPAEGRQRGHHKNRRHIFHLHIAGAV